MENHLSYEELQEIFRTYKKCPRCLIVKPIEEGFYKCRSECKNCRGLDLKGRRDKKKENQ